MEQRLGVLVFLTGLFPQTLSVFQTFTLFEEALTWSEARAYCQVNYTDLAIIESTADAATIKDLTQYLGSSAWIGLYNDMNSWKWSMDDIPLGNFTGWQSDEPNNWRGNQLCTAVSYNGWWDASCGYTFPFLCFDGTKTGNDSYVLITDNKNWTESQSYCRRNYTDLVSDRDEAEHANITNLVDGDTWFGLHRDGWKWTYMTTTFPINWASDQPDNYYGEENCGDIYDGFVGDDNCTDIRPFICSLHQSSRQMIRLQVESDLDVNDPTVKAEILEIIKQKLMMLGVSESIKVTWREPLDMESLDYF